MHLSPEEIAAAEACGISFLPASDAQVQRMAMQRKIFYRAGAPILATRGDGFFETVGTLQQLIKEGRQQQRDLSQWLEATPGAATTPEVLPEPTAAEAAPMEPAPVPEQPVTVEPAAPVPKRPRQKRRRPEPALPEPMAPEPAPPAEAAPPEAVEAEAGWDEEVVVAPLPPAPRALKRGATRTPAVAVEGPGQDRGKRWLMAGAARRGRAGKHWSTRQR